MSTVSLLLAVSLVMAFAICSSVIIIQNSRRRLFMSDPVGWKVKYWVDEEAYCGTVKSVMHREMNEKTYMILFISGHDGELSRDASEVNPISKPKTTNI